MNEDASKPFEGKASAEIVRRESANTNFVEQCLAFLAEQELGERYLDEAIDHEGGEYFDEFFDAIEELEGDYERYVEMVEEANDE